MARCILRSLTTTFLVVPPVRFHPPSATCKFRFKQISTCKISSAIIAARVTGMSHGLKLSARAFPEDLVTESSVITETDAETCEIVQGFDVTLGEGEDTFQGYLIQAIKNNNGAGVLFLSDVYGFENGDTRDFAYRLACFGYNVLVPDLFRGSPRSKESSKSDSEEWRKLHPSDRVAGDIDVATNYLVDLIDDGGKLAVLGFCYGGGRLIETLAKDSGNLFTTGAFLYGTRFESSLATQIKVPLLLIAGDNDVQCSPDLVYQIEQQVQGSKAKIYAGFGHAFAHHPSSFEEDEAAEDAFTEIRHWLHDHLLSHSESTD